MEGFESWLQFGGLGLGGIALILIFTGRLWPKAWVDARMSDKDAIIAQQKETLDKQGETIDALADTNAKIIGDYAKTTNHALGSIQSAVERRST